ncbi:MAG: hypothetical protein ACO3N7_01925 [Kiritimatiellia bacterium]
MKKLPFFRFLLGVLILSALTLKAQPVAFDISGTLKTVEKNDSQQLKRPLADVDVKEKMRILEITLRRTNPTVSGEVKVEWLVVMQDIRGRLRPATRGEQAVSLAVGIEQKLESAPFSIKEAKIDFDNRWNDDKKVEQEVEGYAIILRNPEGEEVGAKFQPKSLEEKVRQAMAGAARP